jgi:sterol desaturase/sphingolipid hydroxylase (fatty acid hydroxylase superfamily)
MVVSWDALATAVDAKLARIFAEVTTQDALAQTAAIVLVLLLEVWVLGYSRSSLSRLVRPSPSARADLFYFGGRVLGYGGILVAISSFGLSSISMLLADAFASLRILDRVTDPLARALLFLVLTDFLAYWVHRARHRWDWWWELHKLHHSASEFNVITTSRGHPLDIAAIVVLSSVPLAVLGGSASDFLVISILFGAHAALSHSMLDWHWGWFGRYVVFSPMGHRIHHSPLPEHYGRNFGSIFPVWDWLFGTFYVGDKVNQTVGLPEEGFNRGILADILHGTRRAALAILPRLAKDQGA